jgi:NAD(P)-dependent dehydrogenase (short-subunit alcohol dehydrogenase family)
MELLVPNLLDGRTVALAGGVRRAVEAGLSGLGARLVALGAEERDPEAWAAEHAPIDAPIDALVYDAATSFGAGGDTQLRAAVDGGWSAIHTAATAAFIPAGRGGTIVLLAPRAGAGARATAARAALENTARTLSIEWARFGITTTAITPGAGTSDEEIATLIAFLVSAAGRYFSGCRFDLGAVG